MTGPRIVGHLLEVLTPREREVVDLICEGNSNESIANRLEISEETVKRHLQNIMQKTRCASRTELAVKTLREQFAVELVRVRRDFQSFDLISN